MAECLPGKGASGTGSEEVNEQVRMGDTIIIMTANTHWNRTTYCQSEESHFILPIRGITLHTANTHTQGSERLRPVSFEDKRKQLTELNTETIAISLNRKGGNQPTHSFKRRICVFTEIHTRTRCSIDSIQIHSCIQTRDVQA